MKYSRFVKHQHHPPPSSAAASPQISESVSRVNDRTLVIQHTLVTLYPSSALLKTIGPLCERSMLGCILG